MCEIIKCLIAEWKLKDFFLQNMLKCVIYILENTEILRLAARHQKEVKKKYNRKKTKKTYLFSNF